MIIFQPDVFGISLIPFKTKTPLIIHPNAVLILTVAFQSFQMIGRRNPEIIEGVRLVQHEKLSKSSLLDLLWNFSGDLPAPDSFSFLRSETFYHEVTITQCVIEIKSNFFPIPLSEYSLIGYPFPLTYLSPSGPRALPGLVLVSHCRPLAERR